MKIQGFFCLSLVALSFPWGAFAQTEVLGVTLGTPISELRECPAREIVRGHWRYEVGIPDDQIPCYRYSLGPKSKLGEFDEMRYEWEMGLTRPSFIPFDDGAIVITTFKGVVHEVWVTTRGESVQAQVAEALRDKFGPPTRSSRENLQNAFGVQAVSLSLKWVRPDAEVSFMGIGEQFDSGAIWLYTNEQKSRRDSAQREQRARDRL